MQQGKKKNREEKKHSKIRPARTWLNSCYHAICMFLPPLMLPLTPTCTDCGYDISCSDPEGQGEYGWGEGKWGVWIPVLGETQSSMLITSKANFPWPWPPFSTDKKKNKNLLFQYNWVRLLLFYTQNIYTSIKPFCGCSCIRVRIFHPKRAFFLCSYRIS